MVYRYDQKGQGGSLKVNTRDFPSYEDVLAWKAAEQGDGTGIVTKSRRSDRTSATGDTIKESAEQGNGTGIVMKSRRSDGTSATCETIKESAAVDENRDKHSSLHQSGSDGEQESDDHSTTCRCPKGGQTYDCGGRGGSDDDDDDEEEEEEEEDRDDE